MRVLISLFLVFISCTSVFPQSVCPIVTLKVNKVSGKVIDGGRLKEPLQNIKLELRNHDEEETLVATTVTDKSGLFEFENIKKGKYIFNTYFEFYNELYLIYRAGVKVENSNSSKSKPSILIKFGFDCYKTEISKVNKVKEDL